MNEPLDDLVVLIPVYNDWEAVGLLLEALARALAGRPETVRALLLDDGSAEAPVAQDRPEWRRFRRVDALTLRRNLGHQRAIAVGLCHVEANIPCRAVVVMDGDGEDAPADVPRLLDCLAAHGGVPVVFAERAKRSESLTFRLFYQLYRGSHWALTGIAVRVGNFSVVPQRQLRRLVAVSELWNHYAAAVFKSRLPFVTVPTQRATRLAGKSRMNFVALVMHGLSAISVFSDRVGVRMLIAAGGLLATAGGLLAAWAGTTSFGVAAPAWLAPTALGMLALATVLFLLLAIFVFVVLGNREGSSFLPLRDYVYFVAGSQCLHMAADHSEAESPSQGPLPPLRGEG